MVFRINRKRWMLALAVFAVASMGLVACGGNDDDEGEAGTGGEAAGRAAFISLVPVTQGNWDPAGYQAFTAMAEKYGLEATNQERVSYGEAPAVLRRLAPDNDMIIAHSSGYEAAVLEVAPEFPDTWFVVFSDLSTTEDLPNVAGWAINWNQLGYLGTTAACYTAKSEESNTVGHVNSEPIPAFTRFAGGSQQAADDLGCDWLTIWTQSFEDVAKAKQAALSMIADGAEALTTTAETGDEGIRDAVVEEDKLLTAIYTESEIELAPKNTITSVLVDFKKGYDEIGALFTNDELAAKIYPLDVEEGHISYATPFENVDQQVEQQSLQVFEEIKSGEIEVDSEAEIRP
jgi:basic membrane protein A